MLYLEHFVKMIFLNTYTYIYSIYTYTCVEYTYSCMCIANLAHAKLTSKHDLSSNCNSDHRGRRLDLQNFKYQEII